MDSLIALFQWATIAAGLIWLFVLLATPHKTCLHLLWGVFCGSLCLMLVKAAMGDALGTWGHLVGMAASATCNVFWLVSRALFRSAQPIQARHLLFAAAMTAPIALWQFMQLASARDLLGDALYRMAAGGISAWVQLLASGVLLLTFWEGARGWRSALSPSERRLRRVFLGTYAVCALACTLWTSPTADPASPLTKIGPLLEAISAFVVVLVMGHVVRFRARHPLPGEAIAAGERSADESDIALAQKIEACVRDRRLYLEPELKVADLADVLAVPDYRVSRAITQGLGHSNFNRYINGYRIDHARRLLSDPALQSRPILSIAIDSGFASIGPFNRAFKASTGRTPSAFRHQAPDGLDAMNA